MARQGTNHRNHEIGTIDQAERGWCKVRNPQMLTSVSVHIFQASERYSRRGRPDMEQWARTRGALLVSRDQRTGSARISPQDFFTLSERGGASIRISIVCADTSIVNPLTNPLADPGIPQRCLSSPHSYYHTSRGSARRWDGCRLPVSLRRRDGKHTGRSPQRINHGTAKM
ncbi:hypothetical protein LZ31DRAFT_281905 [Colletotrichum somersetense]|nr:hypothetical protein LZ31DRAFT_281905 [Colletotrichum somersetense]